MRRITVTVLVVGFAACGGKETTVSEAFAPSVTAAEEHVQQAMTPDAAVPVPALLPLEPTDVRPSPRKLSLKLRSTPSGAAVSVDGKLLGVTPTVAEVQADNRQHEFTFVLGGYEPWRLRFVPSNAGVIHATLVESLLPDAAVPPVP